MDTIKQRWIRLIHHLNSARFLYHFHGGAAVVWGLALFPSYFWWRDSVFWVVVLSWWALVATHWGAWQSARAELGASRAESAVERVGGHITVTTTETPKGEEVTITTDDATEITVETE